MANGHSEDFKCNAVRIAVTKGLTRLQVASDLDMDVATLNTLIQGAQDHEDTPLPDAGLVRRVDRRRKENTVATQGGEIFKRQRNLHLLTV